MSNVWKIQQEIKTKQISLKTFKINVLLHLLQLNAPRVVVYAGYTPRLLQIDVILK